MKTHALPPKRGSRTARRRSRQAEARAAQRAQANRLHNLQAALPPGTDASEVEVNIAYELLKAVRPAETVAALRALRAAAAQTRATQAEHVEHPLRTHVERDLSTAQILHERATGSPVTALDVLHAKHDLEQDAPVTAHDAARMAPPAGTDA